MTPRSPEQRHINSQRSRISRHVHNHVVGTDKGQLHPSSLYRFRPVDDPDYEALYDLAKGNPTMFAIHAAEYRLELDMDEVLQDQNDPNREKKIEKARQDLASLHFLELQYLDPLNHPFEDSNP